jgi:glycosyltransferase involved in cell wall biosynthesis
MKKRITYIVNADWYFQMHWLERATAAKNSGFQVSVVTPVTELGIKESIEENGIKVIPWNLSRSGRHIFRELSSINQLCKIVKLEKPDLVHCITVKPNIYAFFLSLFMRLKLILSVTGLGMLFTSDRLFDRASGSLVKNLYGLASRKHYIFFENNDDLGIIKSAPLADSSRLKRVMGAGVSSRDYAYSDPAELHGTLNLLFAARLLQPKGLDVLFDAVRELNEEGYSVKLRVAGIFDYASPLAIAPRQIEEWSKYPFFEFLGNRKDVSALIANSHFVCLPSSYGEGIPRVLIEATAIGRAIITTDVPGCREICTDNFNGFLVAPATSRPIVEALKGIYSDPLKLETMCRNSNTVFLRGYDSEQVIAHTLSAYTERLADS